MPKDSLDDIEPPTQVGRVYSGEVAPPITTPEAVATLQAKRTEYARKSDAISIQVYFAAHHIDNPIMQASMLAYTDIRVASVEDFDKIFAAHHEVPALGISEDKKPTPGGNQ